MTDNLSQTGIPSVGDHAGSDTDHEPNRKADRDYEADADTVEELLRQPDQSKLEIGKYLAERYFQGLRSEYVKRRSKSHSLRKLVEELASRKLKGVSKAALGNYIQAHFQEEDLDLDPHQTIQLSFAARVRLLRVKDLNAKRDLAHRAVEENLSVRDLEGLISKGKKGRRMSSAARLQIQAKRILHLAEGGFDIEDDEAIILKEIIGMLGHASSALEELMEQMTVHARGQ